MAAITSASLSACVSRLSLRSSVSGRCLRSCTAQLPCRTARLAVTAEVRQEEKMGLAEVASQKLQALAFVAVNAMAAMPAFAEEEKGKIFDFNLTLPIMAVEFLLLMIALDNIWFKPVSKIMDSRDEEIRKKLIGVRDNSGEISALQLEAETVLKAARAETALQAANMKKELAAELDAKLQASRARIEKELEAALGNLEKQKVETLQSLDSQVQNLSDQIVQKVIPFKV